MKLLYYLLFFCIPNELHSQNCKTYENKKFFKSIKFGSPIPGDLMVCANHKENTYFHINYDRLSQDCKKKYTSLFTFLSVPFSFADIGTNNKGQIMSVELYSILEEDYRSDSISYIPPPKYLKIYNKLVSVYGKPTSIIEPSHMDSLTIKYDGMPTIIYWQCNYIILELQVNYGAQTRIMNSLHIRIKNRHFEFIEEAKIAH